MDTLSLAVFGTNPEMKESRENFVKFMNFILPLCFKTLPGIARFSLCFFLTQLSSGSGNKLESKQIWTLFFQSVLKSLNNRKPNLTTNIDSLIASAHTMTFPGVMRNLSEHGGFSAKNVNEHFFKYGTINDSIFDLWLYPGVKDFKDNGTFSFLFDDNCRVICEGIETFSLTGDNDSTLRRFGESNSYEDVCYFPSASQDIILNKGTLMSLINILKYTTIASIYKFFLIRIIQFTGSSTAIVQESFPFEVLAAWSIGACSHISNSGLNVVLAFIVNVQYFNNIIDGKITGYINFPVKLNKNAAVELENDVPKDVPLILENFLANEIKFPDLINENSPITSIREKYQPYCSFGRYYFCRNKDRCDVKFEVETSQGLKECFIECKFLASPIGLSLISTYYNLACNEKCPVSILLCRKIQAGLKRVDSCKKLDETEVSLLKKEWLEGKYVPGNEEKEGDEELVDKESAQKKQKTEDVNPFHLNEKFFDIWRTNPIRINIYAVSFECFDEKTNNVGGKIKITTLKEFANPDGVFLIVESNFSIPPRSSHP